MASDDVPKGPPRTAEHWDARYAEGDPPPWDTGRVDNHVEALVQDGTIEPCRALDVGCGTGVEAVWLAQRGFDVTGVDWSVTAVERARRRADEAGVKVEFSATSFPPLGAPFDLVYDCGCFHTNDTDEARIAFAREVAQRLAPGGRWLSICGSTEGPPRDHGPPRLSARDLAVAVEPALEILSLTDDMYDANVPTPARAWVMLARKRA